MLSWLMVRAGAGEAAGETGASLTGASAGGALGAGGSLAGVAVLPAAGGSETTEVSEAAESSFTEVSWGAAAPQLEQNLAPLSRGWPQLGQNIDHFSFL